MILIHPLVTSIADFLTHVVQWVFQTVPQTLILSPSGPQHPIYSFDSYLTDEDLLYQVHSPSTSFFLHSVSIYPTSPFPVLEEDVPSAFFYVNPFSFHPATSVLPFFSTFEVSLLSGSSVYKQDQVSLLLEKHPLFDPAGCSGLQYISICQFTC